MLILTRKKGESIIIGNTGDEIIVTIMEVDKNNVRLGIDAPPEIQVDRQEIRIKKDNDKKA